MNNLDHLIPDQITSLMQLKRFDFELNVSTTACDGRWPWVKVTIENEVVFDNCIIESQKISYSNEFDVNELAVSIEYYNKQDNDTTVDSTGQIVENQSVTISNLTVNGIDIVKTQLIYRLGMFYQKLSTAKQKYYTDNGFDTGPSHTLFLCENGIWKLNFKLPVVQHLVKLKARQAPGTQWPNPELLSEIHTLIQDIRRLTN